MTFERTFDYALVREILTHPAIFPHITEDASDSRGDWQPPEHPAIWYVLAKDGDELLGLYMLAPQNSICWEIHVAMLPHAWGAPTLAAVRAIAPWIFASTPCRRLVCGIRATNRLAIRRAREAGMTEYGRNPASWQKDGQLHDQVLLGISKG